MTNHSSRRGRLAAASPRAKGFTVLVVLLLFTLLAFNRPRVETTLAGGETLKAEFSRAYKLAPYQSVVKLAGVKVGMVVGVDDAEHGSVVEMKLDDGILDKLGTAPRANIRPTLVLGGKYYVELVREGQEGRTAAGSTIPVARTTIPVELDRVLTAVTPDAADSIGDTVQSLDATFGAKGQKATRRLLDDAPATLRGTKDVLAGLRGTRPRTDLTGVVTGLQHTAAALTRDPGQWSGILDDLATTSAALADGSHPLAAAIDDGPQTLTETRAGLADLDGTLDRLETTARSFRPSARALAPLLDELDPVLVRARPVLADARAVAHDARPVVQDLVPVADDATTLLDDVSGPVLDRLRGPVTEAVLSPWHGSGVYEGGGNDHRLYEETGYLLANFADVFKFHDKNGAMGRLMAGVGLSTAGGILGYSLEELLEGQGMRLPAGPQDGSNEGEPPPPLGSSPSYVDRSGSAGLTDLALPLVTKGDQ
jgi:phospholipid/cholesterol/gamma-HCH transport system substrate-binding protein